VWLYPEFKDGKVFFHGDSDAVLVKGIVALLVSVYSNATPDEILGTKPDFLKEVGITEHLSMNRSNGLASMMKQMQMYALVFKSMNKG
jgi:cysteine desulfuration protein SufE